MDDLKKRGSQDRSKINMSEDYEVKYWSEGTTRLQGAASGGGR